MVIPVSVAGAGELAAFGAATVVVTRNPNRTDRTPWRGVCPIARRQALLTGTPLDNIRERNWLSVQRRLWTHDYSPQAVENIGLVPQYFALALTDLVVETAYGGVGAGAGPDLGQRVELAPNLFGLRCDFDLRFRGAVGHPWESAPSCTSLNRCPSGLGKTRTGLDRDAGASRTTWVSVWANRARASEQATARRQKGGARAADRAR